MKTVQLTAELIPHEEGGFSIWFPEPATYP